MPDRLRYDGDDAPVQLRLLYRAHQRRVAAVAPAENAQALRVGDARLDEMTRAIGDVVDGRPPVAEPTFSGPIFAEAGGSAIAALQHRIAAGAQELRQPVIAPVVDGFVRIRVVGERVRDGPEGDQQGNQTSASFSRSASMSNGFWMKPARPLPAKRWVASCSL